VVASTAEGGAEVARLAQLGAIYTERMKLPDWIAAKFAQLDVVCHGDGGVELARTARDAVQVMLTSS
jgi:hypothetical protein